MNANIISKRLIDECMSNDIFTSTADFDGWGIDNCNVETIIGDLCFCMDFSLIDLFESKQNLSVFVYSKVDNKWIESTIEDDLKEEIELLFAQGLVELYLSFESLELQEKELQEKAEKESYQIQDTYRTLQYQF